MVNPKTNLKICSDKSLFILTPLICSYLLASSFEDSAVSFSRLIEWRASITHVNLLVCEVAHIWKRHRNDSSATAGGTFDLELRRPGSALCVNTHIKDTSQIRAWLLNAAAVSHARRAFVCCRTDQSLFKSYRDRSSSGVKSSLNLPAIRASPIDMA